MTHYADLTEYTYCRTSRQHDVYGGVGRFVTANAIRAFVPLTLFLVFLCAILVWNRRRRGRTGPCVLIRIVTTTSGSPTRPSLMAPESEPIARRIAETLEGADLGPVRVLLFQGKPTTDLIIETTDSAPTASRVQTLLVAFPVTVSSLGRPGDVQWHSKLWRHL